jgi:transcriptional regulator with XRE-family HTH domain
MAGSGINGGDGGNDGRARFGTLLARALKVRAMKQDDLAGLLGTTQSSVSGWVNGKYEPAAATVFAIERTLSMEPGQLSRLLGYLPLEAASRPVGVDTTIAESPLLDEEDKAVLIALFELLAAKQRGSTVSTRSTSKAVANRARLSSAPSTKRPPSAARPRTMASGR